MLPTDADTISRWWHMWPDANLGIATGGGFAVLDIDPRNGGDESLERLEAQQGEIVTKTVRTGGGGLHLYLRSAADLPNRTIAPGIEVKSKGLLVIAPPSLHVSGEIYEWIDTGEGIQVVPDWLVDLVWTNSKNDLTTPFVTHVTLPSFLDVYRPFAHIYVLKGSICHIRHRWFGSDEASTTLYRPLLLGFSRACIQRVNNWCRVTGFEAMFGSPCGGRSLRPRFALQVGVSAQSLAQSARESCIGMGSASAYLAGGTP